ncbi:MAG: MBL fold metallo-hydrolase, partial [Bacteroidota bacterium]
MNNQPRKANQSENYRNGSFHNLSLTPVMAENASFVKLMKDYFQRPDSVAPSKPLPSVKTDLKALHSERPVIVWFGHSSYLIHVNGINILVDPVFSGSASPFSFMVKAFAGADAYTV